MKKRQIISFTSALALLLTTIVGSLTLGVSADSALPSGATIGETAEKLTMQPGDIDWVIGSTSTFVHAALGQTYYTDYAKAWAQNSQSDSTSNQYPEQTIFASSADVVARTSDYYWGEFMGKPVYSVYTSVGPWCHGGLSYKVQGSSYVAAALVIKKSKTISPAEYVFESSVDGSQWTTLSSTITLDYDATDPVASQGKGSVSSVYKAVVKIPDNATQLRITMPGGEANSSGEYYWPGKGYESTDAQLGTVVVSAYDLSQYSTLNTVPEFKSSVLTAGTFDNLSDDYYYDYYIRSTWKDADNYNWNTADQYASVYAAAVSSDWNSTDWPSPFGTFMGQTITKVIKSNGGWNGSSLIYRVEPNKYIATALVKETTESATCFQHYGYEVSADGSVWTTVVPTITQSSAATGGVSYYDAYKTVVKIPDGMTYYRITLPGFNRNAANGNEMTWAARDPECEAGLLIGCSIASSYDLTLYDSLADVPDSPFYVDVAADLKAAVIVAQAVNLDKYKDDAAKTEFVAALDAAESLVADHSTASQSDIDIATARLETATQSLNTLGVPSDATIGQDDAQLILKPGVADWLKGSVYLMADSSPLTGTDGQNTWYSCYTDYAKVGLISTQNNLYQTPQNTIHATNYDFYLKSSFSLLKFMDTSVNQAFINCGAWAGSHVIYRVYANSYVASSIVVNTASDSVTTWPNIQNNYVFQVSGDGSTWETVTATLTKEQTEGDLELYKAVVKIPENAYYYRVIMPGAKTNTPDTEWYAGNPIYNHTFLGPTIASMYDLSQYSTYSSIPDATAWYADASLTSKDTAKLTITNVYFKCIENNMTIADALALLNIENADVAFYAADGTQITDTTTKLAAGMKVDILDAKGLSLSESLGLSMLTVTSGTDLLSISPVSNIEVACGVDKTVTGLKLPSTTTIEAGNGSFGATINWNVDGCAYDPSITQKQEFTVTGTVVLPDSVTNNSGINLTVTAKVVVLSSTNYGVVSKNESKIKVDNSTGKILLSENMTLAEIKELLTPVGEVFIYFSDKKGNEVTDLSVTAEAGMTVDVYTSAVLIKSYDIGFMSDSGNPITGYAGALIPVALLTILAGLAMVYTKKARTY